MMTELQMSAMLAEMDELDAMQAKFAEEVAGSGGAAWAIERYAGHVIYARQLARIVRPLLEAYEKIDDAAEWFDMIKAAKKEYTQRLIRMHGRSNSTSLLSNAINQWEAEAMSYFVERLDYVRWE